MDHAARGATLQLRLGELELGLRGFLVAGTDRRLDALQEGPDAADAGGVDFGAPRIAADTLLSGLVMSHLSLNCCRDRFSARARKGGTITIFRPARQADSRVN